MSRLLGFIRPDVDPEDAFNYWIWQATDFPKDPRWDYERLQIQQLAAPDGNILVIVLGAVDPTVCRVHDGVFLRMHMNAAQRPQPKTDIELSEAEIKSWNDALDRLTPQNLQAASVLA